MQAPCNLARIGFRELYYSSRYIFLATEKEKWRTLSEFEFRFLPDGENKKRKWKFNFVFFYCKKNENRRTTIKFEFHFPIQLKIGWHKRYTDSPGHGYPSTYLLTEIQQPRAP